MESTVAGRSAPESPTNLRGRRWFSTLKRTVVAFREDNLTDWAASLTYYSVLSIFPALIALVSILGLISESATGSLVDSITTLTPSTAGEIIESSVDDITASQGSAGLALVLGFAGALWAASGYVGGFTRASNTIYGVEEGRPFWKLKPFQILLTVVMVLLLALCGIAVVVTGPVAEEIGGLVGLGDAAVTIWDVAKWPVIALVVVTIFAMLYWAAPNIKQPKFRWITPGGILAVVLWLIASGAFAFYVANFSSYNATYGTLAGVVIFLVWLWITNLAVLLGAEFNAELERQRELEAGVPEDETIALEPRIPPS
jgi:membrane protein